MPKSIALAVFAPNVLGMLMLTTSGCVAIDDPHHPTTLLPHSQIPERTAVVFDDTINGGLLHNVAQNANPTHANFERPLICPAVYQPMCGTVNGTRHAFGNRCEAHIAHATDITLGGCGMSDN